MSKKIIISSFAVILASIFFVVNDAIINYLAPLDIKFYHFVFYGTPAFISVPLYLFYTGNFNKKMYSTNYYIPLIRSFTLAPLPFFTFISLNNMSLPEFTTINMSAPFFGGILSIIFLKDKFNFYILTSLFLGFVGVFFVIQPGFEAFNIYFLLTLFSSFLIAINSFVTNKYNQITSSIGYFIYGGIIIHIISLVIFIYDPLTVSLFNFFLISIASIFINSAIFLMVFAFQYSQKYYASVFCLLYTQILWTSIVGLIFFNEFLNNFALFGALIIVLSGIISIPGQYRQLNE